MTKTHNTKINDYVRLDTLDTNVEKFVDEGYVNYIKRTGGQVNQFYSLSDSEDDESGRYRETEVIFSREIFRRAVLTTKLFPIGIKPDAFTTSFAPRDKDKDDFYLRDRINPSTVENTYATMRFVGGEFKNIRRTMSTDDKVKNSFTFVGGEFRLPRFDLYAAPESVAPKFSFVGGVFKKALITTRNDESIRAQAFRFTEMLYSTRNKNDVLEINFKSKTFPQESNKVSIQYINNNTTTVDSVTYLTEGSSLRTLSKSSGAIITHKDGSSNSYYGKISLGLDFFLRGTSSGGYILTIPATKDAVKLNDLDGTQLEIITSHLEGSRTETNKYVTPQGTLEPNKWYKLIVETDDSSGQDITKYYLNGELVYQTMDTSFVRNLVNNERFILGNSTTNRQGVIANFDRLYVVKNTNLITDNTQIDKTTEIVASDLDLSEKSLNEKVSGVSWTTDGPIEWEERKGRNAYTLIANSLYSSNSPDLTINPANNYKIEVEIESARLPTVDNMKRTILTDGSSNGYELSLVYYNNGTKVKLVYDGVELLSYSFIRINTVYKISVYKIRQYLVLAINDKFDNLVEYQPKPNHGYNYIIHINPLTIGKDSNDSENNFYGYFYGLKMINFYRDEGLFDKYYPENVSDIVVLNFEEGYLDEGGTYREWKESNSGLISTADKKFGDKALKLGSGVDTISIERDSGLSLGTNDFTFETWLKPTDFSNEGVLLTNGRDTLKDYAGLYPRIVLTTEGKIALRTNARKGSGVFLESKNSVPLNQWSHVAVVRDGKQLYVYVNGKREGISLVEPPSIDFSYDGTFIGNTNLPDNQSTQYKGYIDSLRLVKGIPIYTGETYNVPTLPASTNINTSILRVTYEQPVNYTLTHDYFYPGFNPQYRTFSVASTRQDISRGFGRYTEDISNARYKKSYEVTDTVYRFFRSTHGVPFTANDWISGTFTFKASVYIDEDTPISALLTYGGISTPHWALLLKDGHLAIYENNGDVRLSSNSLLPLDFNKWYVVTLVKKENRFLVFLDGTLVLDEELVLSILTASGSEYPLPVFKGNINDIYFSRNTDYFDTHIIRYPLYFKDSFKENNLDRLYYYQGFNRNVTELIEDDGHFTESFSRPLKKALEQVYSYRTSSTDIKDEYININASSTDLNITYFYNSMSGPQVFKKTWERNTEDLVYFTVTRDDASTRVYVDGQLTLEFTDKPTTSKPLSGTIGVPGGYKTRGFMKGLSLTGTTIPKYGSHNNHIDNSFREPLIAIASDNYNIVPRGKVLDVRSDTKTVIKGVPDSVWRTGAYFKNKAYQIIENFNRLPSKRFSIELWINPEKFDCDLINLYSLDKPELSYLQVRLLQTGQVYCSMKSVVEEVLESTTESRLNLNEWQHIRVSYGEGSLYTYVNGTLVKTELGVNPGFYETQESNLVLGIDLNNKSSFYEGIMDYIKINRVPELLDLNSNFNPLDEVMYESNIPNEDLEFPNIDFTYGLTYWDAEQGILITDNKEITCSVEEQRKIRYSLDLSQCILDKNNKLWVSYLQSNENEDSKGSLTIRFYCTTKEGKDVLISEKTLILTSYLEESLRYFIDNLTIGVTKVELEFSLNKGTTISNISILVEEISGVIQRTPTETLPTKLTVKDEGVSDYGYSFRN